MRKIAVVAVFAILAAMVPASVATAQPEPGSLDGVGTLMEINAYTSPVDLWIKIDNVFQKQALSSTDQQEFQLPKGDHAYQICTQGSTSGTCAGGAPLGAPGSVHVASNDILNFLIQPGLAGPTGVFIAKNATDKLDVDKAELTLVSVGGAPIDFCVGDKHTNSTPLSPPTLNVSDEFDGKDGEGQTLKIYIPGAGAATNCAAPPTSTKELGFPAGSNTVINIDLGNPNCTSDCGYQIFPGNNGGPSSNSVSAFCTVVLQAANITPWLQALVSEIEVGNSDTYPSPDHVEKVINQVADLLDQGNESAPADIKPAWLKATAQFVLTGRLAAVQYDLSALPQDDLRRLVDGIEHPGADDPEEAANTAALTAWVTANCFNTTAVEAQPSFTG